MSLLQEFEATQNPALGAILLWEFANGYTPSTGEIRPVPLPLLFLVLPVCLRSEMRDLVLSTRRMSGLRKVEEKLRDSGSDRVWTVQERVVAYRSLTTRSLALALATQLLKLEAAGAGVWRLRDDAPEQVPETIRPLMTVAERLGSWCGETSLHEVMMIFKVRL